MTKRSDKRKKVTSYAQYSGLAYQLIGLLFVGIWLGRKADTYFGNEIQYITALSCILVLFAFFYKVYRVVSPPPNKK